MYQPLSTQAFGVSGVEHFQGGTGANTLNPWKVSWLTKTIIGSTNMDKKGIKDSFGSLYFSLEAC